MLVLVAAHVYIPVAAAVSIVQAQLSGISALLPGLRIRVEFILDFVKRVVEISAPVTGK